MSYHNDPYRVDYLKIYPCLKERPDVLEVLKKSDRKMKYMEVDLKSEQRRKNGIYAVYLKQVKAEKNTAILPCFSLP